MVRVATVATLENFFDFVNRKYLEDVQAYLIIYVSGSNMFGLDRSAIPQGSYLMSFKRLWIKAGVHFIKSDQE